LTKAWSMTGIDWDLPPGAPQNTTKRCLLPINVGGGRVYLVEAAGVPVALAAAPTVEAAINTIVDTLHGQGVDVEALEVTPVKGTRNCKGHYLPFNYRRAS